MNLKELVAKLPEADRAEAETVIQAAIVAGNPIAAIDTKEKAIEFIGKTPLFESASMFIRTKAIEAHDAKFKAEELPKLVEAKMRELNPPTDPRDIKLAEFEKKLAERDRKELEAKQREIALRLAASEGIPVDDVERFISDNDDATSAQVKAFATRIKAYRAAGIEEEQKKMYGNVGKPKAGSAPGAVLKTQAEIGGMPPKERADFFAKGGAASD
jgi:hypothetical protein